MNDLPASHLSEGAQEKRRDEKLNVVLLRLLKGGPEQQAIEAGEIDAVIDYSDSNVIVFPAARHALRPAAAGESTHEAVANNLLAALTQRKYQRLAPFLEAVTLTSGAVLHEPGEPVRFVYFAADCVVSLLATPQGRPSGESDTTA